MHIKDYNGFEIKFPGPDLHQEEIDSIMSFLYHQLEEIDNYSDKSLFFQNPQIFEGWLALVRVIEKIETWEAAEDKTKWEDRTETYVTYLLTLREYYFKYQKLYKDYYEQLSKIMEFYGGWLEGDCISADGIEALSADNYYDDLENVDDIILRLNNLNRDSLNARSAVYSVLTDILGFMMPVMNRGALKITGMNPTIEDFAKAIDDDLREWTFSFGKVMFREMKEELNRHFKEYRTAPYTPELWGELLATDEKALILAKRKGLADCDTAKQEHWGEDMKKQMDENSELMQLIYSSCRTDDDVQRFISLLTPDNLSMFYDIIIRRNLIQCEMYSELKTQHDEWLNPTKEDETENPEIPQAQLDSEGGVNNEEPAEEERFRFIHVEIEDEEAWRIHKAIKRLVANYRIPDICIYLKEQKQNGKLMLPSNPSAMYNELVRLGMPKGEGFSEKNFSNSYMK